MNWLYYLAEANLYLGVFYLAYCLFLNRNTHYQLSRAYLIFSCVAAFALPVLQVSTLRNFETAPTAAANTIAVPVTTMKLVAQAPAKVVHTAPVAVAKPVAATAPVTVNAAPLVAEQHITLQQGILYTYLTGVAVLMVLLLVKFFALFKLTRGKQKIKAGEYQVIYLNQTNVAFSFFNYLFISSDSGNDHTIIRHELVHIRQKHSADVILLEVLKIVNWFNPLVYLLQNSLKTVHEYIADEQTAAYENDTITYASFLLNNAYGAGGPAFTHSFFNYNLLKKRIMMLTRERSGRLAKLKYLLAIPVCAILLCTSTLVFSKTYAWDLTPNVKHQDKGFMATLNRTAKRKRLKVTQNGVATITDQLSIDDRDQTMVYNAANLTPEAKELLDNQNIKVEVVIDSTRYTTRNGQLIMPIVNLDGYFQMDHFLHKNVHYTSAKNEKGGLVEVEFTLDNNRHITNLKVVKSGGPKLDALALNGFNAYHGIVNDDAGKTMKIGVYFFTDDYSIFKTDSLGNDPEFAGELIIPNYQFPMNRTAKGFEYDESGGGPLGTPAKAIIYDKNDEAQWFFKNKCTAADLQMLKDKYGYTFPSGSDFAIQLFDPKLKRTRLAFGFDVRSYLETPYANDFYEYMLAGTVYPEQAKKNREGGVVVLNFDLGSDGKVGNVSVAKSAGRDFDEAAMNALQGYKSAIKDNAGKHSIAVTFCVGESQYHPVISDNLKKDGYVGEVAVCSIKSPIVRGSFRSANDVHVNESFIKK